MPLRDKQVLYVQQPVIGIEGAAMTTAPAAAAALAAGKPKPVRTAVRVAISIANNEQVV